MFHDGQWATDLLAKFFRTCRRSQTKELLMICRPLDYIQIQETLKLASPNEIEDRPCENPQELKWQRC